jgi:hypothetical protein
VSFRLPPSNHPAREAMGDMEHVVDVLNPANLDRLQDFGAALRNARKAIAAEKAVKAINVICLRADDERWLIRVGKRGGWRRLWNFGTGRN